MESRARGGTNIWTRRGAMSKVNGLTVLSVLYAVGLAVCALVGGAAPELFITKTSEYSTASGESSASSTYVLDISAYQPTHQSIYFSMRLKLPIQLQQAMDLGGISEYTDEENFEITAYGSPQPKLTSVQCPSGCNSCSAGNEGLGLECNLLADADAGQKTITCIRGEDWCSWTPLYHVDFVHYHTYYWLFKTENDVDEFVAEANVDSPEDWTAQFRVVYVSQWYTAFEIAWFYFWMSAALVIMFLPRLGFFAVAFADDIRWRKWSPQQKWVAVLLVILFFFNNPFFAAQVHTTAARGFFFWFAIAEGVMVSLLLMFWLDRLFDLGRSPEGGQGGEAVARGIMWFLTAMIFVTYVVNMIQIRVSREGSPDRVHKYPETSSTGEQALTVLIFVYCFWVLLLGGRAWWSGSARETLRSSPQNVFLAVTSAVTLIILLPSIVLEHLSPRVQGGVAFCLAHGSINLYVLAMALLCAPRASQFGRDGVGIVGSVGQSSMERGGEESDVVTRTPSYWWRQSAGRPKIADSSIWEDER